MSAAHAAISAALRGALDAMGAAGVDAAVDPSARPEFGDWSTPAPLRAAKVLRRAPMRIAEDLRARLAAAGVPFVREWSVSPPGYVNARLDETQWVPAVLAQTRSLSPERPLPLPAGVFVPGKTLVEHTSINTNKAAHVGHLRNACLGDTVARILRRTGHTVEVNNYIDDTGVQVADVVVGLRELHVEPLENEPFDRYCSRVYVEVSRRYEQEPELQRRRRAVLHEIEARDNDTARFVKELAARVVRAQLATMRRFDIRYDLLTWESDIIELGFWEQAFSQLRELGAIEHAHEGKYAGCWIMHTGETDADGGDDAKVLVKSDGVATYTAKDIAYHLWKFGLLGRDFHYTDWDGDDPDAPATTSAHETTRDGVGYGHAARSITAIDARQAYLQQVVRRALHRLGYEQQSQRCIHLGYEVVALTPAAARELGVEVEPERTGAVALSGRRGIEVRADDLLDRAVALYRPRSRDDETAARIAYGAVRYYLQKFSLSQIIAFDFDDALRISGDTGVYVQMAHARCCGILRKVGDDGGEPVPPAELLPVERALLHRIDTYPLAVAEAAEALSPVVLTTYTFALASALTDFYEHTPPMVREEDPALRRFRRALVAAARETLADALGTLGLPAPEQV